jgi:hypothetical protein
MSMLPSGNGSYTCWENDASHIDCHLIRRGALLGLGYQNQTGCLGFLSFNVSADGQRFRLSSAPEQQSAEPLTLILNWASALNK